MFYIIIRPAQRRRRTFYIMNISEKLSNNSLYGLDNVSKDSLPGGNGLYSKEWEQEIFTLPPESKKLLLKVNHHKEEHHDNPYPPKTSHKNGFLYTGIIIGIIAVILIVGFLLYRLMKRLDVYTISPERMPEIRPECHHPTCGQYCTLARGGSSESTIYNSHHSIHTLHVTSEILPTIASISHERNAHINVLDTPPSYMSSMRHSTSNLPTTADSSVTRFDKYDLPPSYSEAISYMSPSDRRKLRNNSRSFS